MARVWSADGWAQHDLMKAGDDDIELAKVAFGKSSLPLIIHDIGFNATQDADAIELSRQHVETESRWAGRWRHRRTMIGQE